MRTYLSVFLFSHSSATLGKNKPNKPKKTESSTTVAILSAQSDMSLENIFSLSQEIDPTASLNLLKMSPFRQASKMDKQGHLKDQNYYDCTIGSETGDDDNWVQEDGCKEPQHKQGIVFLTMCDCMYDDIMHASCMNLSTCIDMHCIKMSSIRLSGRITLCSCGCLYYL